MDFDGLWLNFNEPSNTWENSSHNSLIEKMRMVDFYDYVPGNRSLDKNTIPMKAAYITDLVVNDTLNTGLNFHSLTGIMQSKLTYEYLR